MANYVYIVRQYGYYEPRSRAHTSESVANKICERLGEKLGNQNSCYVEEIELVDDEEV